MVSVSETLSLSTTQQFNQTKSIELTLASFLATFSASFTSCASFFSNALRAEGDSVEISIASTVAVEITTEGADIVADASSPVKVNNPIDIAPAAKMAGMLIDRESRLDVARAAFPKAWLLLLLFEHNNCLWLAVGAKPVAGAKIWASRARLVNFIVNSFDAFISEQGMLYK